jgi:hypothetical protein
MTDTPDKTDDRADDKPPSRRKRRGTGPISTEEERLLATARPSPSAIKTQTPVKGTTPSTPKFGRYERPDFERVESMLAAFANRRLGPLVNLVAKGFYGAANDDEKNNPGIRTAFYSFFLYGYRDPKGIRAVDLFAEAGLPLEGRQRAALDACLQARLVIMSIDDVHAGKHRMRGRDLLRDEPVTAFDRNASSLVKPGERLMCWQIPWGTSWQPIGYAVQIEQRKAIALERSIETLCNGLRAVRRELPEQHAANLWWVGHRVANL